MFVYLDNKDIMITTNYMNLKRIRKMWLRYLFCSASNNTLINEVILYGYQIVPPRVISSFYNLQRSFSLGNIFSPRIRIRMKIIPPNYISEEHVLFIRRARMRLYAYVPVG